MKRKSWLLFVAGMLMFSGRAFAEDSVVEALGVETNVSGTIVAQGTLNTNDGKDKKAFPMSSVFNVEFVKKFDDGGKVKAHFKGDQERGLNNLVKTYGKVNGNADDGWDDDATAGALIPSLVELYYQHTFFDDKLTIDFGISDFGFAKNKFAGSSDSQFITGAFAGDRLLKSVSKVPALRVSGVICDELDFTVAYFAPNYKAIHEDGVAAVQFNIKPLEGGNYRLYGWANLKKDHYKFEDKSETFSYGGGISCDQEFCDDFGAFVRAGYKNHLAGKGDKRGTTVEFTDLPESLSWSAGVQMKGSAVWSISDRENDVLGIAGGQIMGTPIKDNVAAIEGYNTYKKSPETHLELYYKLALNQHIAIIPEVQYFLKPRGGNVEKDMANADKDVFVFGVRTSFNF